MTPWTAARQASPSITNSRSRLKLMSMGSVMPSSHLLLCCPLLLLLAIFPSIRVFSSESVLSIRWPEYWSFSDSPSNEYSGLISLTIDWFDLLAVQGTLKSLFQHRSLKASTATCLSGRRDGSKLVQALNWSKFLEKRNEQDRYRQSEDADAGFYI